MEKYLAFDAINGEHEFCDTIEEARGYLKECFLDPDEGYHPDTDSCKIFKLVEEVKVTSLDFKSNYKYESEDDVPEDDIEALENEDFWPHSSQFDEVWEHEFVKVCE